MSFKENALKLAQAAIDELKEPGYNLMKTVDTCFPYGFENDDQEQDYICYVAYYMTTVVRWIREGAYEERLPEFLITKSIRFGQRGQDGKFPEEAVYMQSHEYMQTWNDEGGDLEELYTLIKLFTYDELAALGI
jgi:hypothetical protein